MTAPNARPAVYVFRRRRRADSLPWGFVVADQTAPGKWNTGCSATREAAVAAAQARAPDGELIYGYPPRDRMRRLVPGPTTRDQAAAIDADTATDLAQVLRDLVAWAAWTGGWEAPCWQRAETLARRLDSLAAITGEASPDAERRQDQNQPRRTTCGTSTANADQSVLLELHPLPWTIQEDWQFGDQTPLTIMDGNGAGILAVSAHAASIYRYTDARARDYVVAERLICLVADAGVRHHSTSSARTALGVPVEAGPGEAS